MPRKNKINWNLFSNFPLSWTHQNIAIQCFLSSFAIYLADFKNSSDNNKYWEKNHLRNCLYNCVKSLSHSFNSNFGFSNFFPWKIVFNCYLKVRSHTELIVRDHIVNTRCPGYCSLRDVLIWYLKLFYLQNWQFFLVLKLISQFLDLLQTYVAAVLFWIDLLKNARQLKQVMAP